MKNEKIEAGKSAAELIERGVNSFSNDFSKELISNLTNMHRTLQQSFHRDVVMEWIKQNAKSENFDGRNEATVKQCKAILKFLEENNLEGLPMV